MPKAAHLGFKFSKADEALMEKLPEPFQEVLLLSKTMGTKSIAEALGVADGTAKSRLNRARTALVGLRMKEQS